MTRNGIATCLVVLCGCTVEAGHGFGTIESAELSAAFEPGGRLGDDGSFLVRGGYLVSPTDMRLEVHEVRLQELVSMGGGSGEAFDPANPPPGYTLCHGGHCHHVDGRLVDYEDIQAELSGSGGAEYVTRATFPVGSDLALLEGTTRALDEVLPSAELPEGTLSRVVVDIGRFRSNGTVTGGALAEALPIRIDVAVEGALTTVGAAREVSVDAPAEVRVFVRVPVAATFLDDQDLSAAVTDGEVVVESGTLADEVALQILATPVEAELE